MSRMERRSVRALFAIALVAGGCRTRLYDLPATDAQPIADQSLPLDLAVPPDLSLVDFALPPICRHVYVVDENRTLASFDTDLLQFVDIGTLDCPAMNGATPFSMSIARDSSAYVLYNDGELFHVDTTTAACRATPWVPSPQGFTTFGMGFVADSPGSSTETLYVVSPSELGIIDLATFTVRAVAPLMSNPSPELTGTADAELWGFFPGFASTVTQIDKTTGARGASFDLPALAGTPTSWAFAFWGGSFWIFLARQNDPSTAVYRLDRASGQESTVLAATGRHIVGAGVSSCAPLGMDQ